MKPYPPVLEELAAVLGTRRNANNRQSNVATGTVRADGDKVNVGGALCELIVLDALSKSGHKFVANNIFEDGFVKGPDFIIDYQRYDIKQVTGDELRVNEKSHRDLKADVYAFVKVDQKSHSYERWIVPWEDVEGWDMRTVHSPFRYKKI